MTQDPITILQSATKPGYRTSEFWLSLLGIGAAVLLPAADSWLGTAGQSLAQHGTAGAIAAGAIAGAYSVGRAIVKSSTASSLLAPVPPPLEVTSTPAAPSVVR